MSAQERQMLRSKDVLERIVLSAVCIRNPERFGPQLLQKGDNVIVLDKSLFSG